MIHVCSVILISGVSALLGQGDSTDLPFDESQIVDQRAYSDSSNACGPASILNLLKFSRAEYQSAYDGILGAKDKVRIRFFVDRYFRNRRSVIYKDQKRWGVHGVQSADLVTGLNEFLSENALPKLNAGYLDRQVDESAAEHLNRCHEMIAASIENGVAPIISLRSYLVREQEGEDADPAWETGRHHNLVVIDVSEKPDALGFRVVALDPWMGRKVELYLHVESNSQGFRALKGVEESGKWLNGEPFLQVLAPQVSSLQPVDLKWSERFVVVANFLIGDY
mgnify:CR=1 FL=1